MSSAVTDFIDWEAFNDLRETYDEDCRPTFIVYRTISLMLEALADDGWAVGDDDGVWFRKKAIEWRERRTAQMKAHEDQIVRDIAEAEAEAKRIEAARAAQPRTPRCEGRRKDGGACLMGRQAGTPYCRHHQNTAVEVSV